MNKKPRAVVTFLLGFLTIALYSLVSAQVVIPYDDGYYVIPLKNRIENGVAYFNNFSTENALISLLPTVTRS